MKNTCPTCGIHILKHEASRCLDEWVHVTLGYRLPTQEEMRTVARRVWEKQPHCVWFIDLGGFCFWNERFQPHTQPYSSRAMDAYSLMEWVWEKDPTARIEKDCICLSSEIGASWGDVHGPTFPVRVCRAAIWLANLTTSPKQST